MFRLKQPAVGRCRDHFVLVLPRNWNYTDVVGSANEANCQFLQDEMQVVKLVNWMGARKSWICETRRAVVKYHSGNIMFFNLPFSWGPQIIQAIWSVFIYRF